MILSAQSIRARVGMVQPFNGRTKAYGLTFGLGPAGYDVRVAEAIDLRPGGFVLASTVERFAMPLDVLGIVHDKSTLARFGLAAQNTVIEPGWHGYLTLELSNHSDWDHVRLAAGSPVAQIIFHLVDQPTEQPYDGKYQNQPAGAHPGKLEPGGSDAPAQNQGR